MKNLFISVDSRSPNNGQEVIAYKIKLIRGVPVKTSKNCVPALYLDGKYYCDFEPTHWAEMPGFEFMRVSRQC